MSENRALAGFCPVCLVPRQNLWPDALCDNCEGLAAANKPATPAEIKEREETYGFHLFNG